MCFELFIVGYALWLLNSVGLGHGGGRLGQRDSPLASTIQFNIRYVLYRHDELSLKVGLKL